MSHDTLSKASEAVEPAKGARYRQRCFTVDRYESGSGRS